MQAKCKLQARQAGRQPGAGGRPAHGHSPLTPTPSTCRLAANSGADSPWHTTRPYFLSAGRWDTHELQPGVGMGGGGAKGYSVRQWEIPGTAGGAVGGRQSSLDITGGIAATPTSADRTASQHNDPPTAINPPTYPPTHPPAQVQHHGTLWDALPEELCELRPEAGVEVVHADARHRVELAVVGRRKRPACCAAAVPALRAAARCLATRRRRPHASASDAVAGCAACGLVAMLPPAATSHTSVQPHRLLGM